ncbi:MAG: hypothetical protein ABMA01_02705 [Chthoniobacteraceae bacterium]
MSSRAPDAEEISVVLLGSFNPGIFHPEWFRRQEILLPQEAEEAKLKVLSPEVTEVLFLDMKLDVFPDRFVLETNDASRAEKLQDIVINVLTRLPHTPITACGLNDALHFDLKDEAYWHKIGHELAPKELIWSEVLEKPGMETLVVKGTRGGEFPGEVNVTVAPSKNPKMPHGLFVRSNFHFPVPRNESGTPRSELVVPYVQKEWKSALEQARRVAYRIFDKIKKEAP